MSFEHRIWKLILAVALTFLAGILGYEIIEGWNFLDAAYMTVITLATIGYGETHPLSDSGRIFTMFLILGGMTTVSYGALTITAMVADGELAQVLKRRRMDQAIAQLQDHYIICGFGQTGEHVVEELLRTARQIVVVDKDPAALQLFQSRHETTARFGSDLGVKRVNHIVGDAALEHVLTDAGIHRAAGIFCVLPTDKDNLFVVLTARGLSSGIRIVSRCIEDESEQKLRRAGADSIISPTRIGGLRMASEMVRPAVVSFLDQMVRDPRGVRFEDIEVQAGSPHLGRPLTQTPVGEATGLQLIAVALPGQPFQYHPSGDLPLAAGQRLVFLGPSAAAEHLRQRLNQKA